jgi:hypothetical protein
MRKLLVITLVLTGLNAVQASSFKSTDWNVGLAPEGVSTSSMAIGSLSGASDNASGAGFHGLNLSLVDNCGLCLEYREQGAAGWAGATGYYSSDYRAPYVPGQRKSYGNIYLWGKNVTLSTPYRIGFQTAPGVVTGNPTGYTGHLVLDYVPAECQWDGNTDFWLDLSVTNHLVLPTIVTDDPLQGTRFHIDVYAPVPEPSSVLVIAGGLLSLIVVRRRA